MFSKGATLKDATETGIIIWNEKQQTKDMFLDLQIWFSQYKKKKKN